MKNASTLTKHRKKILTLLWTAPVGGVIACAGLIWVFAGVLEEVLDNGGLVRRDEAVNLWFHAHATPVGLTLFEVVTQLGGFAILCVIVVGISAWLWHQDRKDLLWAWVMTNGGGAILQYILKASVHRTRPPHAAMYLHGDSYSFPSGHTMGATVCYVFLVLVAAAVLKWSRTKQILAYFGATILVLVIGLSRLYLGVHYPSDVIGGGAAGGAWIVGCITWFFAIHRRNDQRNE